MTNDQTRKNRKIGTHPIFCFEFRKMGCVPIFPRVVITMGDPSGIGPEVTAKALSRPEIYKLAEFIVVGDKWAIEKNLRHKSWRIRQEFWRKKFKFIDLSNVSRKNFRFGKVDARYGRASFEYLETAVRLIKEKKADCLVTGPVDKEAINKAGIKFSGHTEYLADEFGVKDFAMMLMVNEFRFSLATRHLALKKVSLFLSKERIFKAIILTDTALKKLFAIKRPRIGVCALNPHASDGGLFGDEEAKIIRTALKKAEKKGCLVFGPRPSDSAVKELVKEKKYDAIVSMYHDQALIPLKILGYNRGVNLTIGLPFVRTAPLHGVGFDIAGKSKADPASMAEAIKLAVRCFKYSSK